MTYGMVHGVICDDDVKQVRIRDVRKEELACRRGVKSTKRWTVSLRAVAGQGRLAELAEGTVQQRTALNQRLREGGSRQLTLDTLAEVTDYTVRPDTITRSAVHIAYDCFPGPLDSCVMRLLVVCFAFLRVCFR